MIFICYLAAGNSIRFGKNKLLFPFRGKPLYQHGLDMLEKLCRQQKNCQLFVISQYQTILDDSKKRGITGVYSPNSRLGMSYTIRCAIESIGKTCPKDRILFVCADQPFLMEATVLKLMNVSPALADCREDMLPVAACASRNGEMGNPVLFSSFLADELSKMQDDCGGKSLLKSYPNRCLKIPCQSDLELLDVDTVEDIDVFSGLVSPIGLMK